MVILDDSNFSAGFVVGSPKQIQQNLQYLIKLVIPLVASFSGVHIHTGDNKSYAEYSKSYSKEQGHAFEKITGDSDTDNVFPKVAIDFSDKLLGFVIYEDHSLTPLLVSIGQRAVWGNCGGSDGNDWFDF